VTDAPPRRRRSKLRRTPVLLATAVALGAGAAALPAGAGAATPQVYPANQQINNLDGWNPGTPSCTILGGTLGVDPVTVPQVGGTLGGLLNGLIGAVDPVETQVGGLLNGLLGAVPPVTPATDALLQELLASAPSVNGLLGEGGTLDVTALLNGLDGTIGEVNTLLDDLSINCGVTNSLGTDGNPGGALKTQVSGLLNSAINVSNLIGDARATWTSAPFVYSGGTPTDVSFVLDARTANVAAVVGGTNFGVTALLRNTTTGAAPVTLGTWTVGPANEAAWSTVAGNSIPKSAFVDGHRYTITLEIVADEALKALNLAAPTLQLDNVRLSVTPGPVGPGGPDGPGGPGTPGGGATGGDGDWIGAGGLGARTTNNANPPAAVAGGGSGKIVLSRQQLLINQRISQAGVRRVNTVIDKLTGGLTGADFQNCTVGANKFQSSLLDAIKAGTPAAPATAVQPARTTATRVTKTGNPGGVKLSRGQLLINQRISQAAVRRVNAIQERLDGNVTAGDFRAGTLNAITLDSTGRRTFANALPSSGPATSAFVALDIKRKAGNPGGVKLSKGQLVINQRISQAAVRRVNAIQARLRTGLTGAAIKNGSLTRATLAPGIQLGQR